MVDFVGNWSSKEQVGTGKFVLYLMLFLIYSYIYSNLS